LKSNKRFIFSIFFLLFLGCSVQTSYSQKSYSKEFGIKSDNDVYTSAYYDRYYTNGTFLYFRYVSKSSNIKKINEFEIGQKMYTPQFSISKFPEAIDRPYAGYSFIKYSFTFFSKKNYSLKSSFELGILGPSAMAQELQAIIHKAYGYTLSDGWEYQIQNALGINLGFQFIKPFSKAQQSRVDFTSVSSLKSGTIITEITTNIYGRINLLRPSLNSYENSVLFESNLNHKKEHQKKELFLFFKPQIGYALYNATIQGSFLNINSPITYKINAFIYEIEIGIKYAIKRFDLSYSIIKHSKKTETIQDKTNNYGSIRIAYKFN